MGARREECDGDEGEGTKESGECLARAAGAAADRSGSIRSSTTGRGWRSWRRSRPARRCRSPILKTITGTTDGNLSVHARRLEEAGYVLCEKTFAGRTPRTEYRLSAAGRRAFEKYLDHMDALIKATRKK